MSVESKDVIHYRISDEEIRDAIQVASKITDHIIDRGNLHDRDYLERFIDCLLGEVAEKAVIAWLRQQGKYAESSVDKTSTEPDPGHDIWVLQNNVKTRASIKSSVSALKSTNNEILNTFTIASQPSEVREINIQVYFWLQLYTTPRKGVPCVSNCAIFAWAKKEDLTQGTFQPYSGEMRQAPSKKLKDFRPMNELLQFLK